MKIPYRNLSVKNPEIRKELLDSVERVLSHGRILLGPEVGQFEEEIAQKCNKKYAIGMGSGTDALYLALKALEIGAGDEVITTPLSWIATTNAITLTGATPIFIDIKEDLNLNVDLIEEAITPKTKAILPVHFTGKMSGIIRITEIAKQYNLHVIEDAAQAFAASISEGMAGSFGTIGCFSMNPMKVLCAYGEAGVCVTDNDKSNQKLRSLAYAGTVNREDCHTPSLNGRLDTLQAAMMLVNLKYVKNKVNKRIEIASVYRNALKDVVGCPDENGTHHVYYSYTIVAQRRDELQKYLSENGIETKIQHPILMPYHTAYKGKFDCKIPVAEDLVQKILCLPNQEDLTLEEIDYVIEIVKRFYGK